MNSKQLGILLALVVVLGGAGLLISSKRGESWSGNGETSGQKLLGKFEVNDVAQLVIQQGSNTATITKKDERWRVTDKNDYPADFGKVSGLLLKLRNLKVIQTEQVGASQLGRLDLLAPGSGANSATLLDLRDGSGKSLKSILLGKKHMQQSRGGQSPFGDSDEGFPDGRYVMTDAKSGSVALISDALADIEPKPEQWIAKDFIKVEKPKSIAITYTEGTNSFEITREKDGGDWTLVGAKPEEKLDSSKLFSFSNPLSSPNIADVLLSPDAAQSGMNQPTRVRITTFDGFEYAVNVGAKKDEDVYVTVSVSANLAKERAPGKDEKPEEKTKLDQEFAANLKKLEEKLAQEKEFEKWTYLVSNWTVESLLKKRGELLEEKKTASPEPTTPPPTGNNPEPN